MDPEIYQLILALANAKGTNTKSDYGRLFDSMLGVLTGTYTPPPAEAGESTADLLYQYAPTLQQINDSPYYEEGAIERRIARHLMEGMPAMMVKRDVREVLAAEGVVADDQTTAEYEALIDKLDGEIHSLNVATSRAARDAAKASSKNIFTQGGLPQPGDTYGTQEVDKTLDSAYRKLAKEYKPLMESKTDASGGDVGEARRMLARSKAMAARNRPYQVGDTPNYIGDLFRGTPLDALKSIGRNLRMDIVENTGLLPEEKRKAIKAERLAKERGADFGEAERQLAALEAKQVADTQARERQATLSAERAAQVADAMRQIVARRSATGLSPLMDALVKRGVFLKLTGG